MGIREFLAVWAKGAVGIAETTESKGEVTQGGCTCRVIIKCGVINRVRKAVVVMWA